MVMILISMRFVAETDSSTEFKPGGSGVVIDMIWISCSIRIYDEERNLVGI